MSVHSGKAKLIAIEGEFKDWDDFAEALLAPPSAHDDLAELERERTAAVFTEITCTTSP